MKKAKGKFSILQTLRLIIQIVFFIFLPTLYISALNGVKVIYEAIIHQSFTAAVLPQLIEVIAIIPVTILLGRFFCGWMCAFGSFTDFIYLISQKLFHKKLKVSEQADRWLKSIKYIVLAVLIATVWSFHITLFSSASPWDAFGMLATVGKAPDFSYVITNLTAGFVILVLIIVASTVIERFFCRYLCPMGAVFAIVSKLRVAKIKKPTAQCGNCRMCTNHCAMGIPLYKMETINSGECINCMKCITVCPRGNTSFTVAQNDVRPLLAGAATVAAMTGIYYTGNFSMNSLGMNTVAATSETGNSASANQLYKDGTYQGSGSGFRGGTTTVSVTLKGDKITDISTVSHGDDDPFYNKAYSTVSEEIISSQSSSVDAVSGATYSSNGIMEAVADALSQAKISGASSVASSVSAAMSSPEQNSSASSTTDSSAESSGSSPNANQDSVSSAPSSAAQKSAVSSSSSPKQNSAASSSKATVSSESGSSSQSSTAAAGKYKDGTYQGTGTGFRGATTVSVVVSGGKITAVNVDSYEDDRKFFERAYYGVSQDVVSSQSSNVDAVSGATYSSNGIMEAVANALGKANA